MKTPNYVTIEEHKLLPVGSFVRPIDPVYLPDHIKKTFDFKTFKPEIDVFVYTAVGIIMLSLDMIRRVD